MRRLPWWVVVGVVGCMLAVACRPVDSAEVTVIAGNASPSFAEEVRRHVADGFDSVARMLGHLPSEPITVELAATDEEFARLTGNVVPEWSAAVALGADRIVVAPATVWSGDLNRVIVHEAAHIVIADAAGDRFVPRWFHEGCAQYLAAEWGIRDRFVLVWHTITGSLMTFGGIEDVFSADRVDAGLAYDESWLAVRHLRDRHGEGIAADIVDGLEAGESFPNAFSGATGVWPSEFEADFLDTITRRYGWRSLYLLIPSVWTLILMLAVVAYIVKRRRTRRLMSTWELIEAAEKIVNIDDYRTGE